MRVIRHPGAVGGTVAKPINSNAPSRPSTPPIPKGLDDPTVAELASNFAGAMERWAKAGFKVVSQDIYQARADVCNGCDYWKPGARFGLGKCIDPRCGCTKFKRWLVTEDCPQKKWPRI